jgi:glutamate racemase
MGPGGETPTTMNSQHPIGVFDSGVGGLTVLRALVRLLPRESFIYVGDTARVPYGSKSPEAVKRFSLEIARFFRRKKVKMMVTACNTASASGVAGLARVHARAGHWRDRTGARGRPWPPPGPGGWA